MYKLWSLIWRGNEKAIACLLSAEGKMSPSIMSTKLPLERGKCYPAEAHKHSSFDLPFLSSCFSSDC